MESGGRFSPGTVKPRRAAEPALLNSIAKPHTHYGELVFKESTILCIRHLEVYRLAISVRVTTDIFLRNADR